MFCSNVFTSDFEKKYYFVLVVLQLTSNKFNVLVFTTDFKQSKCSSFCFAELRTYGFRITKLKAVNKSKFFIQLLGRNFVWCTARIHCRTFIIQHLLWWPLFQNERKRLCASYAEDNTPHRTANTIIKSFTH